MTHAVVRGAPTNAQVYLEDIIEELVAETGRKEDRHSLNRLLFKCLRDHPHRLCLIDGKTDEKLTNAEVLRNAVQTARALESRGLRAGDVAVAMAQNHTQYAALYYGALFAGITLFNLEPILTAYEIQHYMKLTKTAIVFVDSDKATLIRQALDDIFDKSKFVVFGESVLEGEISFIDFIRDYSDDIVDYWPVAVSKDSSPLLFTTGGSTGLGPPKVVPITNAGLVAQAPIEWTYEIEFPRLTEVMLMPFHGQWTVHTKLYITAVVYGATILVQSQNINGENINQLIKKYKPTWIVITPPDANTVIQSHKYKHGDLHSIKTFILIGVSPNARFLRQLKAELCPDALLCNRLGMTEAHGYVCLGDKHEPPALEPPVNIFLYKLIDKDGKVVGKNEPGELCLKSDYCLAKTYYGDEEAARNMYTEDGWFRTGDLMREDECNVMYYVDRLKFIVFSHGYPISPLEVENVICSVQGVTAAVVIGLEEFGLAALVVPANGAQPSRDAIKEFVKLKLNPYKHLSGVAFVDALPRSAVGKIRRRKCADMLIDMVATKQCY